MKKNVLITALLAMPVVLTGCMRSVATTNMQPESAVVAVRFVAPSETETWTGTDPVTGEESTQLVVDHAYDGHAGVGQDGPGNTMVMGRHVALWGGPFEASDVTHQLAPLTPGSYTFAFVDPGQSDMIQGWIDVNNIGNDVVQMLQGWKSDIPEQKRMLAYHFETSGRMNDNSIEAFEDFSEQIEAFNRLEAQIDRAIDNESDATANGNQRLSTFLRSAELLMMPGDDMVFHPTTKAVFTSDDLTGVRGGDATSKIVVVADWNDVQRKQDVVNDLFSGFSRYRSVLEQAAERLERRKGLMLLTDHLRNNDRRFVDTETRLQFTLGEIERVDERLSDLRDRRVALAFISGLLSPDGQFAALNGEQQQLQHEMTVLQTEMNQLNALFNEAEPNSHQRVAIERSRQRVASSMEVVEQQSANITEAKTVLATMTKDTDVMHRQGDYQLLTATYVGQDLPFQVRTAVEREALMTVRIETTDRVFVPNQGTVASSNRPKSWFFGGTTGNDDSGWFQGQSGQDAASSPNRWVRRTTTTASYQENQPRSSSHWSKNYPTQGSSGTMSGSNIQITKSRSGSSASTSPSGHPGSGDATGSTRPASRWRDGSQGSTTGPDNSNTGGTSPSGWQNGQQPGNGQGSTTGSNESNSGNTTGSGQTDPSTGSTDENSMNSSTNSGNTTNGLGQTNNSTGGNNQESMNQSTGSGSGTNSPQQTNPPSGGNNQGAMNRWSHTTEPGSSGFVQTDAPSGHFNQGSMVNPNSPNDASPGFNQTDSPSGGFNQGSMTRSNGSNMNPAGFSPQNRGIQSGSQDSTNWPTQPSSGTMTGHAGYTQSAFPGTPNERMTSGPQSMTSGNPADYHHHHNHPNYEGHPNNPGSWKQGTDGTWKTVSYQDGQTTGSHGKLHYGRFVGHNDSPQSKKTDENFCDCPLFVRVFFPPAWFKHEHKKH